MSEILFGGSIATTINELVGVGGQRLWIASAFCRADSFQKWFAGKGNAFPDRRLIVRWHLGDLVAGSSDLETYSIACDNGWRFYVNKYLHAKAFLVGNAAFIGSANVTRRGFGGEPPAANRELLVRVDSSPALDGWFNEILEESREMDEKLFAAIQADVEKVNSEDIRKPKELVYSAGTVQLLAKKPQRDLVTKDLLWTSSPRALLEVTSATQDDADIEHDLTLLGIAAPVSDAKLHSAFMRSHAIAWLKSAVVDEAYFGELTSQLHDDLKDDPTPYRKTVKLLLENLLAWADQLTPDVFQIDRPEHSQRIRLRTQSLDKRSNK